MAKVRVRFAPSPTGPLHIGGLRTALYNFLFARKHDGIFILRIEDTDQQRYVDGAEEYIKEALLWSGLQPDEGPDQGGLYGPYRQSERKSIYQKHVSMLIDLGHAYYAFDTPEELDTMRKSEIERGNHIPKYDHRVRMEMKNALTLDQATVSRLLEEGVPYTVRMKVPEDKVVTFKDRIRKSVSFETSELDDKVILKADGLPTYHLANVVDDHLMNITHVIRGEEWLSSTAHHVLLYKGFGWEETIPEFAHLPLILKPGGSGKLSKRDGQKFGFPVFPLEWMPENNSESFEGFRSAGFYAPAVINFLAMLGWNPGTEQEIFSMDELIQSFDLSQVSKSGARFDFDKALWFNAQYLQGLTADQLYSLASHYFEEKGYRTSTDKMKRICELFRERVQTVKQIPAAASFFFEEVSTFEEKTVRKKWREELRVPYSKISEIIETLHPFQSDHIKTRVNDYIKAQQLKFGNVLPLIRLAISGTSGGPDLFEVLEVMGQSTAVARLKNGPQHFDRISVDAGTHTS